MCKVISLLPLGARLSNTNEDKTEKQNFRKKWKASPNWSNGLINSVMKYVGLTNVFMYKNVKLSRFSFYIMLADKTTQPVDVTDPDTNKPPAGENLFIFFCLCSFSNLICSLCLLLCFPVGRNRVFLNGVCMFSCVGSLWELRLFTPVQTLAC